MCQCGFHSSLTHDPAHHFTFEVDTCPVCRGSAQYERMLAEADKRFQTRRGEGDLPAAAARPADGRRVFTRLMTPLEVQQQRDAAPSGPDDHPGR